MRLGWGEGVPLWLFPWLWPQGRIGREGWKKPGCVSQGLKPRGCVHQGFGKCQAWVQFPLALSGAAVSLDSLVHLGSSQQAQET